MRSFRHQYIADYAVKGAELSGVHPYFDSGWFPNFFAGGPFGYVVGKGVEATYELPAKAAEARQEISSCVKEVLDNIELLSRFASDVQISSLASRCYPGLQDIASAVCAAARRDFESCRKFLDITGRQPTGYMPSAYAIIQGRLEFLVVSGAIDKIMCAKYMDDLPSLVDQISS